MSSPFAAAAQEDSHAKAADSTGTANIRTRNDETTADRKLGGPNIGGGSGDPYNTICKGSTLGRGERLEADESICGWINGTKVWYGIRSYPNEPQPGYTRYLNEVWSANGMHDRRFQGIGQPSYLPAPYLIMQGDGNVVFAGQGSGCLAKPGKRGPNINVSIEGPLPHLVKVRDNDGDIIRTIGYIPLSNNSSYIGGSPCYPNTPPRYIRVLEERQRLTWNEYVCEFDAHGNCLNRFGLDSHGLLAFWRNGTLVWRPGPFHIRGDYLHLQGDGHLTLYRATQPPTYTWTSSCLGTGDTQITVGGDNVYQHNGDGSATWALAGEEPLSLECFPHCYA